MNNKEIAHQIIQLAAHGYAYRIGSVDLTTELDEYDSQSVENLLKKIAEELLKD